MSTCGKSSTTALLVCFLLVLVGFVVSCVWYVGVIFDGLAGACAPEIDRLNMACASLENKEDVQITCSSATGTREWAACERRTEFQLLWDPAPDSGWASRPYASGQVSDTLETADSGSWACSNGSHSLSLYPSSIPSGEEGRAAIAFGNACARFIHPKR